MNDGEVLPATREPRRGGGEFALGLRGDILAMDGADEEVRKRVLRYKAIKLQFLNVTDPDDWRDFDGKPYLEDSGVQKVAQIINLEFGDYAIQREDGADKKGPYIRFVCKMSATLGPRTQHDEGISSSRDEFFGRAHGKDVPLEDVDIESVRKKSITNAQHRLLEKMAGLGGLSWKQLEEIAGIKPRGGVRHKGSEQRRATGAGGWTPKKEEIWGWLLEMSYGDEDGARDRLQKMTANAARGWPGYTDPARMGDKTVDWLHTRVEKAYRAWQNDQTPDVMPGDAVTEAADPFGSPPAAEPATKPQAAAKAPASAGMPKQSEIDPRDDPERPGGR